MPILTISWRWADPIAGSLYSQSTTIRADDVDDILAIKIASLAYPLRGIRRGANEIKQRVVKVFQHNIHAGAMKIKG